MIISSMKKYNKYLVMLLIWLMSGSVYTLAISREVAYLHTDRTVYIAGEKIFYKLYLLDATTQRPSDISKIGYIVLRAANQNPTIKRRIKIESGMAWGSIQLPDSLTSGAYQIVAFTNSMKNYDEQYFFRNEIVIVNGFDKDMHFKISTAGNKIVSDSVDNPLKISTDKNSYSTRQKVSVYIDKTNIKANLSVSVFENPDIQSSCNSIIEALSKNNKQPNHPTSKNYLEERNGKILKGRVVDTVTGQNINNATVLLSCVDTVANLQYAITNSGGIFQMLLSDYYEGKEMFLTIREMPVDQHWKIEVEDEFTLYEKWKPDLKSDISNYRNFLTKAQNIAYVNTTYQTDKDTIPKQPEIQKPVCPKLYFCQAKTVLLSDYTSLNDFKEIVVELFPQVRISKRNGKLRVSVLNNSQKMFSDSEIAIFLDGIYVDDVDKIMKLGSEQIKKIEVLDTERVFGNLVYKGVISIITKSNEIVKTTPCSYSLRIKNDKISDFDNYTSERNETISDKAFPFFKQLLYWNPNLKIKEQESTGFEFFTSDNEGNFILKIEGITDNGKPISYSSNIQVSNQSKSIVK
jgi:hypothetical protein